MKYIIVIFSIYILTSTGLSLGYTTISSYFGTRVAPASGASTFHSGIDIAAPEGSNLVAITDATIIYTGFNGAGGYSIIFSSDNMTVTFYHVDPNFIVSSGDVVFKGDIIRFCWP